LKADFIIFLSSSETVLMQVHLDAPQADLDARGAMKGAGSVPAVLCPAKMLNLMIYIKISGVSKSWTQGFIRFPEQSELSCSALRKRLRPLSNPSAGRFSIFC
jgi:hypothetical protein